MCKEVFQNILCYCLSFWRYEPCRRKRISKHLMLLFIMYRRPFPATAVCISKHLMLLFIYLAISGIVEFLKFQNILCYCLSISTAECRTNRIISKHLMLLFIVMQHRKRDQYPWDNACIESFHSLIKREWLNRFKIRDYGHAYRLVFEYLEAFYNTKRIHSHCDYMSPNDYEELYRRVQQHELLMAG